MSLVIKMDSNAKVLKQDKITRDVIPDSDTVNRVNYYSQFESIHVCLYREDGKIDVDVYDLNAGPFNVLVSDDVTRVEITLAKRPLTVFKRRDNVGVYDTVN